MVDSEDNPPGLRPGRGSVKGALSISRARLGSACAIAFGFVASVLCRVGEPAGVTLEATPAATPQGRAAPRPCINGLRPGRAPTGGFRVGCPCLPENGRSSLTGPACAALSSRSPRLRLPASRVTPAVSLVYRGGLVVERGVASSLRWLFARRARSYRPPCIPPLRSPCGRSEPCSRTLTPAKANEAIGNRQASGPSHEASRGSTPRCLSPRKSRRVPPSRPVAAGEGSDWKRPRERGRSGMTGRFRGGRDSRLENPQSEPDPAEGH